MLSRDEVAGTELCSWCYSLRGWLMGVRDGYSSAEATGRMRQGGVLLEDSLELPSIPALEGGH